MTMMATTAKEKDIALHQEVKIGEDLPVCIIDTTPGRMESVGIEDIWCAQAQAFSISQN